MPVSRRRRKNIKARQIWKNRGKPTAVVDLVTEQGTSPVKPLSKPFHPSSDMWKCGCGVKNANSMSECLHCSRKRPEVSKADSLPNTSSASSTTDTGAKPKEEPAENNEASSSSSLPTLASLLQKPPGDWVCPTCSVPYKKHRKKCSTCDKPKPGAKPVPSNGAISPAPTTGPNEDVPMQDVDPLQTPKQLSVGVGFNPPPTGGGTIGKEPGASMSFCRPHKKSKVSSDTEIPQILSNRGNPRLEAIESHKCYVTGRGIQPKGLRVDDHCDFRVHTENAGGEAEVIVKVVGSGGVEEKLTLNRIDPKTYEYSYVPKIIGLYVVSIRYGGQGVARSPFCVEVGPKESRIRAFGPGLQHGNVGYPACFTVNTNGKTCGFSIEGLSLAKIDYKDNGDGSADISYWPTAAGEYAVHILHNKEDIPQSPFMVDVTPSTMNFDPTTLQDLVQEESNPSHVKVFGPAPAQPLRVQQPTDLSVDCSEAGQETCIVCCCVLVGLKRYKHPFFNGGLCPKCRKIFLGSIFLFDGDGTNSYCIICGYGREVFFCEVVGCNKVYCTDCIRRLAGECTVEAVRKTDNWSCFLCTTYNPKKHGLLIGKREWRTNLASIFQPSGIDIFPNKGLADRQSIRVLSLFDGIGAGKLVLDQLNIQIEKYFASEVEQDAITVAQIQHPGLIHHLGDDCNIQRETLNEIGPIDLLMSGSPCNKLSVANPCPKGLEAGSGLLVSDFCRILWSLKTQNKNRPLFWIYEHVASMSAESRSHISRMLEREPALWDAKHFSSQGHACYVWGNIPGMYCPLQYSASQASGSLDDNLFPARKAKVQKVRTIGRGRKSLLMDRNTKNSFPVTMSDADDRNFGFPERYTNVANLSASRRLELLSQSWSVPVIRHLLSPLRKYFQATSNAAETLSGAGVANNSGAKVTTAVSAANASTSASTSAASNTN